MITKKGRIPSTDYDTMIYVKSDNSLWMTPSNPVELYDEDFRGYNWDDDRISGKNITDEDDSGLASWPEPAATSERTDVARCIKPINPEFEVRWDDKDWGIGTGQALANAELYSIDQSADGSLLLGASVSGVIIDDFSMTNLAHAKFKYPEYAWIQRETSGSTQFRIYNPHNPRGNGVVPGPSYDEVKSDRYFRSDGVNDVPSGSGGSTTNGGSILVFDSYEEFEMWFTASDGTYIWTPGNLVKDGRDTGNDYDKLIYVTEDSQFWLSPSNPLETSATIGTGWGTWTPGNWGREYVPNEFKPTNLEFQINWTDSSIDWTDGTNISSTLPYWRSLNWSGSKVIAAVSTVAEPISIDDAKLKFPAHAWVYLQDRNRSNADFRIANPFNPRGFGYIPGPTFSELDRGEYLRSDGIWDTITPTIDFYIDSLFVGDLREQIITKNILFNSMTVAVDIPANDGESLTFELYNKVFDTVIEEWTNLLVTTISLNSNDGIESYIKTVTFDKQYSANNILLIKCTDEGINYNDGTGGTSSSSSSYSDHVGNVKISIYYK